MMPRMDQQTAESRWMIAFVRDQGKIQKLSESHGLKFPGVAIQFRSIQSGKLCRCSRWKRIAGRHVIQDFFLYRPESQQQMSPCGQLPESHKQQQKQPEDGCVGPLYPVSGLAL